MLAISPAAKGDYGVMLQENQDIREVRFNLGGNEFPLEIPRPPVVDEIDVDYMSPSFEVLFLHGAHESIYNERVLVNLSDYITLLTKSSTRFSKIAFDDDIKFFVNVLALPQRRGIKK